ncbi:MAG: hypothetical protein AAFR70_10670 [Pseudomonadota bacterium]
MPRFRRHVVAKCLLAFVIAAAAPVDDALGQKLSQGRAQFKDLISRSLGAQQGAQQIVFGPLQDRRTLRLWIEYRNTLDGISVDRTTDTGACVSYDRSSAALGLLVADASLVCRSSGSCQHVPKYTDFAANRFVDEKVTLFEEFAYTQGLRNRDRIAQRLSRWRLNAAYSLKATGIYQSFIGTFQFHEIGHIALSHRRQRTGNAEQDHLRALTLEAEADGFAAFVIRLSALTTRGGAASLFDRFARPDQQSSILGICRSIAFTWQFDRFIRRFAPQLSRRTQALPRDTGQQVLVLAGRQRRTVTVPEWPIAPTASTALCADYAAGFADGALRAQRLVTSNTSIVPRNVPGGACPRG